MKLLRKSPRLPLKSARTSSTKKSLQPSFLQGIWGFWFGALVMMIFIGIPYLIRSMLQ